MLSRTSVAVSACANLIIERTVDLVLFRTEDGGEIVGHYYNVNAPNLGLLGGDEDMKVVEEISVRVKNKFNERLN